MVSMRPPLAFPMEFSMNSGHITLALPAIGPNEPAVVADSGTPRRTAL